MATKIHILCSSSAGTDNKQGSPSERQQQKAIANKDLSLVWLMAYRLGPKIRLELYLKDLRSDLALQK